MNKSIVILIIIILLGAIGFFVWQILDIREVWDRDKGIGGMKVITMVTDVGGLGDQGFNDAGWKGIQAASKSFGLKPDIIESHPGDNLSENVIRAAKVSDIILGMGFLIKDAITDVAPLYPDKHFILVDADAGVETNVASYIFYYGQSAYFSGIIAAAVSENKKVGVVEGMIIPPVETWMAGFKAGVETWNQAENDSVGIITEVAGEFTNSEKGEELANSLIGEGCDIVVNVAGATGIGVYKAVREANAQLGITSEQIKSNIKKPVYFSVGTDTDYSEVYPDILVAALKKIPNVVESSVEEIYKGGFTGGAHYVGHQQRATDISEMKYTKKYVPDKALELVNKARELMDNGDERLLFPIDMMDSDAYMETFKVPQELLSK